MSFPQPHRRFDDEGELLQKMREKILSNAQTLTPEEAAWVKKSYADSEGWLNLTPSSSQAELFFEQPNEFVLLKLSNGAHMQPMESISKNVNKLIALPRGLHLHVALEVLEFPKLKQNVVLYADSKNHVLIQGDRENEYIGRGFQDSVRCLVNTPKGSPSRWKGKFVVNLIRVPVEDLLKRIEEILRPQELKNVDAESEMAFQRIFHIQSLFKD